MHGPVQSQLQRAAIEGSVALSVSTASVCMEPYGAVWGYPACWSTDRAARRVDMIASRALRGVENNGLAGELFVVLARNWGQRQLRAAPMVGSESIDGLGGGNARVQDADGAGVAAVL